MGIGLVGKASDAVEDCLVKSVDLVGRKTVPAHTNANRSTHS